MYQSTINVKKKHKSHITIGIHKITGQCLHISEVERGKACNCKCAACGGDLEARLGDINKHHFAHASNYNCVYADEVAIYLELKTMMEQGHVFHLPAVTVSLPNGSEIVAPKQMAKVSTAHYHCEPEQYPPLLVGDVNGQPTRIILEFGQYYTVDELLQVRAEARSKGWDCLRISLPEIMDEDDLDLDAVREILQSGKQVYWLYHGASQELKDRIEKATTMLRRVKTRTGERLYECPIHEYWHYDLPLADEEDCYHCEFNMGMEPLCRCMAQEYVRCLADLELSDQERYRLRDAHRAENDAEHERRLEATRQAEQAVPSTQTAAAKKAPVTTPTPTRALNSNRLHLGYADVKDCSPNSPTAVYDRFGNRWYNCITCKDWFMGEDMAGYGGRYGPAKGTCKKCHADRIAMIRKNIR